MVFRLGAMRVLRKALIVSGVCATVVAKATFLTRFHSESALIVLHQPMKKIKYSDIALGTTASKTASVNSGNQ